MPNTPKIALPYPNASDAPSGAAQIQSLATALDNYLGAAIPRAHVHQQSDYAFPSNGFAVAMTMSSANAELLTGGITIASNRLTVPTTGVYRLAAQARIDQAAATTAITTMRIARNAAGVASGGTALAAAYVTADALNTTLQTAPRLATLTAGDTVEVFITGQTGSTVKAGASATYLSIDLLR